MPFQVHKVNSDHSESSGTCDVRSQFNPNTAASRTALQREPCIIRDAGREANAFGGTARPARNGKAREGELP